MSNLLDLSKRGIHTGSETVKIIEKTVLKPRSFLGETFRVAIAMVIVVGLTWGISNADDLPIIKDLIAQKPVSKTVGISGNIEEINQNDLRINGDKGSYDVDLKDLRKIQTSSYEPLTLSDLALGDKIVAMGTLEGETIYAKGIISFAISASTTTATTTTTVTTTATTTDEIASSTGSITSNVSSTTDSTSTDEVTSTTTASSTVSNIVNTIIETVTEFFTGTSSPATSTEETVDVDSSDTSTTTPEVTPTETVSNEEPAVTPDPAPVVEPVTEPTAPTE